MIVALVLILLVVSILTVGIVCVVSYMGGLLFGDIFKDIFDVKEVG